MDEQQLVADALRQTGATCDMQEGLAAHTSFRIGGPARYFCTVESENALRAVLGVAREAGQPLYLLGRGSNVLFRDEGFAGIVLRLGGAFEAITVEGDTVTAGAGASLEAVCLAARDAGLAGLAFAYGIPGSVGGAVYMNAGAYGGEIKDVLADVRMITAGGEALSLAAGELELGYRSSILQREPWIVTQAVFRLQPGSAAAIGEEMEHFLSQRHEKQPLDLPSAGSCFKRPEGNYAGALIDSVGLRGYRRGDAAVSEKHCGFLVNLGSATCADVLALAEEVSQKVHDETGYILEKEIRVVDEGNSIL